MDKENFDTKIADIRKTETITLLKEFELSQQNKLINVINKIKLR